VISPIFGSVLNKTLGLIVCLLIVFGFSPGSLVQARPLASASDLIDAVNELRASNGLSTYQINYALMKAAQGQSDYQASIGEITHSGPGNNRPHDRAFAAGYGVGATFYISENVAGGTNLSAEGAVSMWQVDDPHLNTLLDPNYRDVGAGVAVSNNFDYYTLDVAYIAGDANSSPTPTLQGTPGSTLPPTSVTFVVPVKTSTPSEDGSIVHTVEYGQTLYSIAQAYKVSVTQLMTLNKISSGTIYVGDKLLIQAAYTPTPTNLQTQRAPTKTPGQQPSRTPSPSPVLASPTLGTTDSIPATPAPVPAAPSSVSKDPLLLAIIIIASAGLLMMVVGSLLKRKSE
jgi:LysM repeat protein